MKYLNQLIKDKLVDQIYYYKTAYHLKDNNLLDIINDKNIFVVSKRFADENTDIILVKNKNNLPRIYKHDNIIHEDFDPEISEYLINLINQNFYEIETRGENSFSIVKRYKNLDNIKDFIKSLYIFNHFRLSIYKSKMQLELTFNESNKCKIKNILDYFKSF